jgi:hypothetical protein
MPFLLQKVWSAGTLTPSVLNVLMQFFLNVHDMLLSFLCLFADLYRAGNNLLDPAKLLGGLDVRGSQGRNGQVMMMMALAGWTICLRLRMVLLHDKYKRSKGNQMLSDYCHFSLEAYIVLTYYNGYGCWKSEVDLERGSESGSSVSE